MKATYIEFIVYSNPRPCRGCCTICSCLEITQFDYDIMRNIDHYKYISEYNVHNYLLNVLQLRQLIGGEQTELTLNIFYRHILSTIMHE